MTPSLASSHELGDPKRAQQEAVGVTLLTGVVVLVALAVGAVVVAQTTGGDAGPTTDLVVEASTDSVTLVHNGGDSLDLAELRVTLDRGTDSTRFTPDAANATGPDARLSPGEEIRRAHGASPGDLTVIVAHRPSSTILLDDRALVPPATTVPTASATPTASPTLTTSSTSTNDDPTSQFAVQGRDRFQHSMR